MSQELSVAVVRDFFERFVGAFATFDATKVAELFTTPGVALRRDGSLVPLTTRDDVLKYYQAALDGYREGGCVSCQWSDLELTRMGNRSALAAVSWTLLRQDGSSLAAWRQSYCLAPSLGGPKIFASAMHAE
jgi:hypothetical protein